MTGKGRIGPFELDFKAAAAVLSSPDASNFAKLARLGGLDPAKDFQGLDLRGLPLAGVDVRGINFSGSDLRKTGIESALRDRTTILSDVILGYDPKLLIDLPPIPEDYLDQVRAMIIAGQSPPPHWVPLISELYFDFSTELKNIDPISDLNALETLSLSGVDINEISVLSGLVALRNLWLDGTAVEDIAYISNLKSLSLLWIDDTKIADISALSDLKSLSTLSLDRTGVKDLSPLVGSTALQALFLIENEVNDVSMLSEISHLTIYVETEERANNLRKTLDLESKVLIDFSSFSSRNH